MDMPQRTFAERFPKPMSATGGDIFFDVLASISVWTICFPIGAAGFLAAGKGTSGGELIAGVCGLWCILWRFDFVTFLIAGAVLGFTEVVVENVYEKIPPLPKSTSMAWSMLALPAFSALETLFALVANSAQLHAARLVVRKTAGQSVSEALSSASIEVALRSSLTAPLRATVWALSEWQLVVADRLSGLIRLWTLPDSGLNCAPAQLYVQTVLSALGFLTVVLAYGPASLRARDLAKKARLTMLPGLLPALLCLLCEYVFGFLQMVTDVLGSVAIGAPIMLFTYDSAWHPCGSWNGVGGGYVVLVSMIMGMLFLFAAAVHWSQDIPVTDLSLQLEIDSKHFPLRMLAACFFFPAHKVLDYMVLDDVAPVTVSSTSTNKSGADYFRTALSLLFWLARAFAILVYAYMNDDSEVLQTVAAVSTTLVLAHGVVRFFTAWSVASAKSVAERLGKTDTVP